MNKFFYLSLFSFIIFFLISRVLFPWNDEPDVTLKTLYFIDFLGHFFSFNKNYLYDLFIVTENIYTNCGIISSVTSLWSYINFSSCLSPLSHIIINTLITFALVSPFFLLFYFFSNFEKSNKFFSTEYLNAIILSILYGGTIYYLGNFSLEKISLILSFFIFLFLKNYLVVFIILSLILLADNGSFIILFVFVSVFYSLSFLNYIMKFKYVFLLSIFFLLCLYLSRQFFILYILEFMNLPVRYEYLLEGMLGQNPTNTFTQVINKYPI